MQETVSRYVNKQDESMLFLLSQIMIRNLLEFFEEVAELINNNNSKKIGQHSTAGSPKDFHFLPRGLKEVRPPRDKRAAHFVDRIIAH